MEANELDRIGWKARGDFDAVDKRDPFVPSLRHATLVIPLGIRWLIKSICNWWTDTGLFINIFKQHHPRCHTGVPIGGIGSGSIGRDFRGGFNRFALIPGLKELSVGNIKANQFILSIHDVDSGEFVVQRLLTCAPQKGSELGQWIEFFPSEDVRYRGLFPRAWTEYVLPDIGVTLICEQISPVIKDNYEDSCLPVTNFVWRIENSSQRRLRISITFTWRNGTGDSRWAREAIVHTKKVVMDEFAGMEMAHSIRGMPLTYGIYARNAKSTSTAFFDPKGDGRSVWRALQYTGNLLESAPDLHLDGAHELGVAVSSEVVVAGGANAETAFVLVWDMPEIDYGRDSRKYRRRYTRYFHGQHAASNLAKHAFSMRSEWQRRIEEWQAPVVDDSSLPEWYRSLLYNELYFVVDGSSSWIEMDDEEKVDPSTRKHLEKYGRYAYAESWEYLMMNTYDVHFYASEALLENWPQLEVAMQLEFSEHLAREDVRDKWTLMEGGHCATKVRGRTPHDLGHPGENPFVRVNAYEFHDTGEWKDLNLKLILSSYRDYERAIRLHSEDSQHILERFFAQSWEIVQRGLRDWDHDGDGMIENAGFADQTYDAWTMTGASAYCGSLWLGAIEATRRMAALLGKKEEEKDMEELLERAKRAFTDKLWNGRYFNFDETTKTIMADQLCGAWFMSLHDGSMERGLIEEDKVRSALDAVFSNNVMKFADGTIGAVNGMLENGHVDHSAVQSEEMWTGVTYAVASYFALIGDRERCFDTAKGIHDACWVRSGLQFQTPEAMYRRRRFRAIGYMRALAIWNIHRALQYSKL